MAIQIEAFLSLEAALTLRLVNAWRRSQGKLTQEIIELVDQGDFDEALERVGDYDLISPVERNEAFIRQIGAQAVLYGATRFGNDPRNTVFADGGIPPQVEQSTQGIIASLIRAVDSPVKRDIEERILREAEAQTERDNPDQVIATKASTAGFARDFMSFVGTRGEATYNIAASLHSSRLANWGFTVEAQARGVRFYKVHEQLDNRICPVCTQMHGQVFPVSTANAKLTNWLQVDNFDDLAAVAPWPNQSKAGIATLKKLKPQEVIDKGWDTPPYHPRCRGILLPVQPKDVPVDVAVLDSQTPRPDPEDLSIIGEGEQVPDIGRSLELDRLPGGATRPRLRSENQWSRDWNESSFFGNETSELLGRFDQPEQVTQATKAVSYHHVGRDDLTNNWVGRIYMAPGKTRGDRFGQAVWRHESGHHFDNRLSQFRQRDAKEPNFRAYASEVDVQYGRNMRADANSIILEDKRQFARARAEFPAELGKRKWGSKNAEIMRALRARRVTREITEEFQNRVGRVPTPDEFKSEVRGLLSGQNNTVSQLVERGFEQGGSYSTASHAWALAAAQADDVNAIAVLLPRFHTSGGNINDLFGAITNRRVGTGHTAKYFKVAGNREVESFANLFDLLDYGRNSPEWRAAERVAPRTVRRFLEMIGEVQ